MRGEVQARRLEGVGRRRRKWHARRRPESRLGGQGTRGAHLEHAGHGRDVGGVEAQRLVEGRGLPSRREGHAMRGEVRARRREGVGLWRGGSGMHGEGPQLRAFGGQGTRGAHEEHGVHVCDLGRVEAHRLVETPRLLPSRKEGARCGGEVRAGRLEGLGRRQRKSGVHGEGPTQGPGAGHARGAPGTLHTWS